MNVLFDDRIIGDGSPCFVTYEAGPTHNGLESALELVSLAAKAGADAVKFQIVDPDRLVSNREQLFTYDVLVDRETGTTETVNEPLYDILCRRTLSEQEWKKVKNHADNLGLTFFATVTFDDELDFVLSIGCQSIKVASADVNHLPFLRKVAETGLCLQLDTGSASIGEIETAIDVIRTEGNENIIIHHCPSGYPARLESINLNVIPTLKRMFPYPVAYSDHTPGWEMDVAAVAMGANMVEKTITLDRATRSVEHIFSLEPEDMRDFIRIIRDVETAMGYARRVMHPQEIEGRKAGRRSTWIAEPVKKGQQLSEVKVEFRRPGYGVGPDLYEQLKDARFSRDLPAGHILELSDLGGDQIVA